MSDPHYLRFDGVDLILRDELAIDRTLLANERTLLAYLRSGVALVIAGVSIMHFSADASWFWAVGIACIPTGVVTAAVGTIRFQKMNKAISLVRKQAGKQASGASGNSTSAA
jgi:putative membrane protein